MDLGRNKGLAGIAGQSSGHAQVALVMHRGVVHVTPIKLQIERIMARPRIEPELKFTYMFTCGCSTAMRKSLQQQSELPILFLSGIVKRQRQVLYRIS